MRTAFRSLAVVASLAFLIALTPAFALDDRQSWDHWGDNVFENPVTFNKTITVPNIANSQEVPGTAIATNGSSVASMEYGGLNKYVLTISGASLKLANIVSSNSSASVKVFDFPTGYIYLVSVMVNDMHITTNADSLTSTSGVTFAVGSVQGTGLSLTSTEVDMCPTNASAGCTNMWDGRLATPAAWNGTTTPVDMYLSICVDSNYVTTGTTNAAYGTIEFNWINQGDY
jgi:hypothetical protein